MNSFGLNHMAVPRLDHRAFCQLAKSVGCVGIEMRQDTSHESFSEEFALNARLVAQENNLDVIAVSEVSSFDDLNDQMIEQAKKLIEFAKIIGARGVNLIPRNDGFSQSSAARRESLRLVLSELQPLFTESGVQGFVEPLGFESASLRFKSDVVAVIEELNAAADFKIIHDTFHHALAGEEEVFAGHTGLVHISGVERADLEFSDMTDQDRVLVGAKDRLGNIDQLKRLQDAGYRGPVSFEPFSPLVQNLDDPKAELGRSKQFIEDQLVKCAA